jgi:hypothetical protein
MFISLFRELQYNKREVFFSSSLSYVKGSHFVLWTLALGFRLAAPRCVTGGGSQLSGAVHFDPISLQVYCVINNGEI